MARKPVPPLKAPFVEAVTAGAAAHPSSSTGEYLVQAGTVWRSDHPLVIAQPSWFVPLGDGPLTVTDWPTAA